MNNAAFCSSTGCVCIGCASPGWGAGPLGDRAVEPGGDIGVILDRNIASNKFKLSARDGFG